MGGGEPKESSLVWGLSGALTPELVTIDIVALNSGKYVSLCQVTARLGDQDGDPSVGLPRPEGRNRAGGERHLPLRQDYGH